MIELDVAVDAAGKAAGLKQRRRGAPAFLFLACDQILGRVTVRVGQACLCARAAVVFVTRVQERLQSPASSENARCARMVAKTGSFQGLQDQVNVWPSWQALCGWCATAILLTLIMLAACYCYHCCGCCCRDPECVSNILPSPESAEPSRLEP